MRNDFLNKCEMLRLCTFIHVAQEHDCREKNMIALLRNWGLFMSTTYVCKLVFFWGGERIIYATVWPVNESLLGA